MRAACYAFETAISATTFTRPAVRHGPKQRDWRIFADFAQILIEQTRLLDAADPTPVNIDATVYAWDSTTIDLCLSHIVDKATGVQCDQTVVLTNEDSFSTYPEAFRRVRYYDETA